MALDTAVCMADSSALPALSPERRLGFRGGSRRMSIVEGRLVSRSAAQLATDKTFEALFQFPAFFCLLFAMLILNNGLRCQSRMAGGLS